jgi:hypothetical protein
VAEAAVTEMYAQIDVVQHHGNNAESAEYVYAGNAAEWAAYYAALCASLIALLCERLAHFC